MKKITIAVSDYMKAECLINFLDTLLIPASYCRNESRKSKNKFEVTYEVAINDKITVNEIKQFIKNKIQ